MFRHIPQSEFAEGRWRNGQGVSWEIASYKKEGAADFSWRFAKARIDSDVPFSIYPGMDRIFMMIEGGGMDLEFEGGKVLNVHEKFVPHEFSCDVPLVCKLRGGPSLDLNLFAARGAFRAECEVISLVGSTDFNVAKTDVVFFALDGDCELNGIHLMRGDAAIAQNESRVTCKAQYAKLYLGKLHRL
jgi:environmental stress-induced protein Ves